MEGPRLLLNRDEKTVGGDIAKGLAPGRRLLHVVGRYVVTGDMTDSFVSQTTASGRGGIVALGLPRCEGAQGFHIQGGGGVITPTLPPKFSREWQAASREGMKHRRRAWPATAGGESAGWGD